jgi:LPS-assembly lipoprotein
MWWSDSPDAAVARLPAGGAGDFGTALRSPRRRSLVAAGLASALLAACGFQLRGSANFAFDSIYVGAPPSLPFTVELKRALAGAGSAKVLDAPQAAQVILDVMGISDDKAVLSLSPGGRAREFLLTKRVVFQLRSAEGAIWLPQDEITIRRTYLYDDTERLAREIQEQRLQVEMQTDAISQIVRRLQAAKKP